MLVHTYAVRTPWYSKNHPLIKKAILLHVALKLITQWNAVRTKSRDSFCHITRSMRYKHKTHIVQLQGIRLKIELNSEMKRISNYMNLPPFETNSPIGCRTSRDSFYRITECPVRKYALTWHASNPSLNNEQANQGGHRSLYSKSSTNFFLTL